MKVIVGHPAIAVGHVIHSFEPPQRVACFCAVLHFKLAPNEVAALAEEPVLPGGDRHADDDPAKVLLQPSDFVPMKLRADVLLRATAHSPLAQATRKMEVGFQVGTLAKRLVVHGPRSWKAGMLGRSGVEPGEPFVSLPITYENALGGAKSKLNPVGVGLDGDIAPRIEDPKAPITSPSGSQPPAGFGPIAPAWPERAALLGTYGKKWLKARWPWLPDDFDAAYFNSAPKDQQLDGFLRGDEAMQFDGLHPIHSVYKSRLPGLRLRLFVNVRTAAGHDFREIPAKADTLWIDLDGEHGTLVWRGHTPVRGPKMREIDQVLAWAEPLAQPPRPASHYQALLAEKIAPPPPIPMPIFDEAAFAKAFADMDKNSAEAEAEIAAAEQEILKAFDEEKARLIADGVDAAMFDAPSSAAPEESLASLLEQAEGLTAEQRAEMAGVVAEQQVMEQEFAAMEADFAKDFPPRANRESVLAVARGDKQFADADLAKLDLSGCDLSGMNLSGGNLKGVNLAGANLSATDLSGADLSGANLAGANLSGARCNDADFTDAVVEKVIWTGVSLAGARMRGQNLAGADLTDVNAERADFARANFAGAKLPNARLARADFSGASLEDADFRRAELQRTQFREANAKKAVFDGGNLSFAKFADADCAGASFRNVIAENAVFEGAMLDRANFTRARLARTQFGDASMVETVFDRADLRNAMFDDAVLQRALLTRANLLRAGFDRADLSGASLEDANAYEAGFWETIVDDAKLRGANLRNTLLG